MDAITTVLGTGAWTLGIVMLLVMAALPLLERLGSHR